MFVATACSMVHFMTAKRASKLSPASARQYLVSRAMYGACVGCPVEHRLSSEVERILLARAGGADVLEVHLKRVFAHTATFAGVEGAPDMADELSVIAGCEASDTPQMFIEFLADALDASMLLSGPDQMWGDLVEECLVYLIEKAAFHTAARLYTAMSELGTPVPSEEYVLGMPCDVDYRLQPE